MLPKIISMNCIDIAHLVTVINGEPDMTRKKAMLDLFNNIFGTEYGILQGRVTVFKEPHNYANTHDLYVWIVNWDYKIMPSWENINDMIKDANKAADAIMMK